MRRLRIMSRVWPGAHLFGLFARTGGMPVKFSRISASPSINRQIGENYLVNRYGPRPICVFAGEMGVQNRNWIDPPGKMVRPIGINSGPRGIDDAGIVSIIGPGTHLASVVDGAASVVRTGSELVHLPKPPEPTVHTGAGEHGVRAAFRRG